MTITDYLKSKYCFYVLADNAEKFDKLDYNKFSAMKRVHEIHYIFWSEKFKAFSIGVRSENAKGKAGIKGKNPWSYIMIPKIINNVKEAKKTFEGICNIEFLHLYN